MRTSLLLIFTIFLFTSCSEYQRVLKNDDTAKKYSMMNTMYENGKYKKALKLMEQIVPAYRGKPQAEKLMFMYANTFYTLEDFYLAGYQFERFSTSYPKSDSVEIASFKGAESYYKLSSRFSLDQKDTYKGIEKLQDFINKFPNSEYRLDANAKVSELNDKLEKKSIETAKQYLRISDFKAAIESFDNFILDNPGSKYRKNAYYGKFEAAYKLAVNSFPSLVKDRLITAKGYYNNFSKYYSDSDLKVEADKLLEDVDKRLNEYKTETSSLK